MHVRLGSQYYVTLQRCGTAWQGNATHCEPILSSHCKDIYIPWQTTEASKRWLEQRKLKNDGLEYRQFNRADSDPLHRTVRSRTWPSPGPYAAPPTATASVMAQRGEGERERGNEERLQRERKRVERSALPTTSTDISNKSEQ